MKWKNLTMPESIEWDNKAYSQTYGKFVFGPVERGFGVTIGNALRRVMLSSIQGAAITHVKFDSALHEFTSIDGVLEDLTDLLLNFKGVRVELHADEPLTVTLEKEGSGVLTAADLRLSEEFTIHNPDHYLATLDDDAKLKMDVTIGPGRGYVPAEDLEDPEMPIGVIPLDALYSPIIKVNYEVDNMRVGRRTDFEKIETEVWTDGSISPEMAVSHAAKILKDHYLVLMSFEEEPEEERILEVDEETLRIHELLKMPVDELELSVRSANCLRAANIKSIGDLVQKSESEMLKYRNFGRKSLSELADILHEMGLHFGMDVEPYVSIETEEPVEE
ncbi:DNA-directed RNA polymerase subunit alpha [Gemmatimonadota bacterium]